MAGRGSLTSGSDFEDIGRKDGRKSGGGGGSSNKQDKIKVGVAVALLLVAGVILAWYYGLIDTSETPPPPTPQEIAEFEKVQAQYEADVEAGRAPPPAGE